MSNSDFLETLKERIVVFDGAMGTNLQVQNLTLDDFGGLRFEGCNENLLVTRPDAVENVHRAFLDIGCDVIETNSFNGTPIDFAEYDIGDKAYEMNVLAASLAKRIAADYSTREKPRWVAGSMGPGRKLPTLGHISFVELKAAYAEQVRGLLDGGADPFIVKKDGTTSLMIAAGVSLGAVRGEDPNLVKPNEEGSIEIVKLLLDRGVDLNAANEVGTTALIGAVLSSQGAGNGTREKLIAFLVERGAKLDARDKKGMTALDHARAGEGAKANRAVDSATVARLLERLMTERGMSTAPRADTNAAAANAAP